MNMTTQPKRQESDCKQLRARIEALERDARNSKALIAGHTGQLKFQGDMIFMVRDRRWWHPLIFWRRNA